MQVLQYMNQSCRDCHVCCARGSIAGLTLADRQKVKHGDCIIMNRHLELCAEQSSLLCRQAGT